MQNANAAAAAVNVAEMVPAVVKVHAIGMTVTGSSIASVGTARISAKVCPAGTIDSRGALVAARLDLSRTAQPLKASDGARQEETDRGAAKCCQKSTWRFAAPGPRRMLE